MGLKKVSNEQALSCMTVEEMANWDNSACKDCKYFGHFFIEDNYDNYPLYYNCLFRNITGCEFVKEALPFCSFFSRKIINKTPLAIELKRRLKATGLYVNYYEDIVEYAKCEENRGGEFRYFYDFMMRVKSQLHQSPYKTYNYELPVVYVWWRVLRYYNKKKEDNHE